MLKKLIAANKTFHNKLIFKAKKILALKVRDHFNLVFFNKSKQINL